MEPNENGNKRFLLTLIKYVLAILWAVAWGILAFVSVAKYKFTSTSFGLLLGFALMGGAIIVFYDRIKKIKFPGGWSLDTARQEMEQIKKDALDKVKKEVDSHKETLTLLTKQANHAEQKLNETIELAKPPVLSLDWQQTKKTAKGYAAKLGFTPSKNQSLGVLVFITEVINGAAKIIHLRTLGAIYVRPEIEGDGKKARLQYPPVIPGQEEIQIEVSEPCSVSISGNYIPEPITINIS